MSSAAHPFRAVMLRPARLHEAQAMAELSRDLIEVGLDWRYTPRRMAAIIADRDTIALVACDDWRLHGFAVMQFGEEHAHLSLLCVQTAQQRHGIGRRLHEWLLASARVAGVASIQLELRADNAAALAFYRSLGFDEKQWLPRYYGSQLDARRMVYRLRPSPGTA